MKEKTHTCILHVMADVAPRGVRLDWWTQGHAADDLCRKRVDERMEAMAAESDEAMSPRRVPGRARWVLWLVAEVDDREFATGFWPGPESSAEAQRILAEAAEEGLREMQDAIRRWRDVNAVIDEA